MCVVFLDRDGVINANKDDYVKTVEEFEFLPGALEGLAKLREAGIPAVIISNQAGVGRGLITEANLAAITHKMLDSIRNNGGEITGVYYCTHRKDEYCDCRKPEIGLLTQACSELKLPLEGSFLIGDAASDIEAGVKAGCRTVFVLSGRTRSEDVPTWEYKPEHIAEDLRSAVDWILSVNSQDL